ncbi:MAG: putative membrane protein [Arenicella sp.]|jgi:uncharacterized membrane protein|nr:hypothetical protein [Zhongshania sp.]
MQTQRASYNYSLHSQRGVATIFAVMMMLSLLAFLAVVTDTGRLYLQKRSLQKNADLAALETALRYCRDSSTNLRTAAMDTLIRNNYAGGSNTLSINPDEEGNDQAVTDNRVQVVLNYPVTKSLFEQILPSETNEITLRASATAKACEPIAVFSVGTRLASLGASDSVVGNLLTGVGLDLGPGLDLMDYNGLAGVTVTPRGLLAALGIPVSANLSIGEFNALLAAQDVSLGSILDATVRLAGQDSLLNLNSTMLQALEAKLDTNLPDIQIGSAGSSNGLFATITSPVESALDVGIDALGLISTAIGVATSNSAVDVDLALLSGGLGGLVGANISAKVGIIEPPSIGIGGIGTTAYSAQTRVFAHIKLSTSDLLGGIGSLLGSLASVTVDIPLVIDLASATGTIEDLCTRPLKDKNDPPQCPAGEDCATIGVNAQIAKICVGDIDPDTIFSTNESCDVGLTSKQLLNIKLLGSSLIGLNTSLDVNALGTGDDGDLAEQQMMVIDGGMDLGATVQDLTDTLLSALLQELPANSNETFATEIWEEVNGNSCVANDRNCRKVKLENAQSLIPAASNGLGGLVGGLLGGIENLLGNILVGNQCTGGGILNSYGNGTNQGCINELAQALGAKPSGQSQSNTLAFLTGLLMEVLKPALDAIGNNLLMPILEDVLGLQLGQTEVNLLGLTCDGHSTLVK